MIISHARSFHESIDTNPRYGSLPQLSQPSKLPWSRWIHLNTIARNRSASSIPHSCNVSRHKQARKEFEGSSQFSFPKLRLRYVNKPHPASQYFSNFLSRSYGTRSIMTSREQSFPRPVRFSSYNPHPLPLITAHATPRHSCLPHSLCLLLPFLSYILCRFLCFWWFATLLWFTSLFSRTSTGQR